MAILLGAAFLIPLIGWGVYEGVRSNSNDVRDWLPLEYAETQQYHWFRTHFGTHDFIVVSWPGCTLDDDRLDRFVQHLTARSEQDSDPLLIGEIHTGRSLLRMLTKPPHRAASPAPVRTSSGLSQNELPYWHMVTPNEPISLWPAA